MSVLDRLKLGVMEFRYDCSGTVLTLVVQTAVFFLIFLLQMISFDLSEAFNRYFQQENTAILYVQFEMVGDEDIRELEKDGFQNIRNLSVKETYEKGSEDSVAGGKIRDISDYYMLRKKWAKRDVRFSADALEGVLNGIFIGKSIFFGLCIATYFLFFGAVCNLYGMKKYIRRKYIDMLISLGMNQRYIRNILTCQFHVNSLIGVVLSLVSVKYVLIYINNVLSSEFPGMYIHSPSWWVIGLAALVVNCFMIEIVFRYQWGRSGEISESERLY